MKTKETKKMVTKKIQDEIDSLSWRPAGHRILIRPFEVEKMSKGTAGMQIILPFSVQDNEQKAQTEGLLLKVGPTAWDQLSQEGTKWAEVGDTVLYSRYGGIKYFENDIEYAIMNDEEINGVKEK